jgi:4-hydroxy-2-oxoglutarate aldolase
MLNGVLLPVTTPFRPQNFDLDAEAFTINLRKWAEHPIAGVVVGGSTGEAPLLELLELARLVDLGRSRPPSYFRAQMTPEALREHFLEVAERSPVPVILYHVPKFVPVDLVPDLVGRLVEHPNIVGIKDSSGDLKNLGALTAACADRASVLVGSGSHLYAGLELGVTGGILAVALIAPGESCAVMEAWRADRAAEAGRAQEALGPLNRAVVGGTGVPGIKHALDLLGYRGGVPRPPLLPPTAEVREKVRTALARAALLPVNTADEPEAARAAGGERVR